MTYKTVLRGMIYAWFILAFGVVIWLAKLPPHG